MYHKLSAAKYYNIEFVLACLSRKIKNTSNTTNFRPFKTSEDNEGLCQE